VLWLNSTLAQVERKRTVAVATCPRKIHQAESGANNRRPGINDVGRQNNVGPVTAPHKRPAYDRKVCAHGSSDRTSRSSSLFGNCRGASWLAGTAAAERQHVKDEVNSIV